MTIINQLVCYLYYVFNIDYYRPPIHMLDLESTLHYALRHEIPLHGVFKGDVLDALKSFVSILARVSMFKKCPIRYTTKCLCLVIVSYIRIICRKLSHVNFTCCCLSMQHCGKYTSRDIVHQLLSFFLQKSS